jgi:hypothetical protein
VTRGRPSDVLTNSRVHEPMSFRQGLASILIRWLNRKPDASEEMTSDRGILRTEHRAIEMWTATV